MGIISRKDGIERIDTNIMVHLITRDDERLLKKARKLFSHEEKLYVFEDVAMMELVFILSSAEYCYPRKKVAEKIKIAMQFPNLVCNKSIIEGALDVYVEHPKLSFVDCYLAVMADTTQETPLWTFDRKLAMQCPVAREL